MPNVRIIATFWNEAERALFEQRIPAEFWFHEGNNEIFIEIPIEEFKTYMIFQFQDARAGLVAFDDFFQTVDNYWGIFDNFFQYDPNHERFTSRFPDNNEQNFISEALGVGTSLSVLSSFYPDLNQADWIRIPRLEPGLDFFYDAVGIGTRFVVEAKGSISQDNHNRNVLNNHYYRIKDQKGVLENNDDFINSLLIGIIGAADPVNHLRAYLVDPPIENYEGDLGKLKLLKRLYFYHYFLQLISPRSNIAVALANRIIAIELTDEYEKFDNIPLLNAKFNAYEITSSYFYNKTSSLDRNYFGKLHATKASSLLYIGLTTEILQILIDQNFNNLLNYKALSHIRENETFNCTLNLSSYSNKVFIEENNLQDKIEKRRNKAKFSLLTEHYVSTSGLNYFRSNSQQVEFMSTISKYDL